MCIKPNDAAEQRRGRPKWAHRPRVVRLIVDRESALGFPGLVDYVASISEEMGAAVDVRPRIVRYCDERGHEIADGGFGHVTLLDSAPATPNDVGDGRALFNCQN